MNQQYDMPWYRCILESTIYHAAYDLFNFFIYMLLLEYTSSVTIILFLNMLMNGVGVFLGFRAKKLLEDELMNYQLVPVWKSFDQKNFKFVRTPLCIELNTRICNVLLTFSYCSLCHYLVQSGEI